MMPWMAESRRRHPHVVGGWTDVLVVVGRRRQISQLGDRLVRYLGQFDHQSGGDKRGHARERVKGWASGFQGGSSSIIEAISIRSSGSCGPAVLSPALINQFVVEQVGPLKLLNSLRRITGSKLSADNPSSSPDRVRVWAAFN
ncbi:hypothetical protein ELH26_24855 (plasmid) [Rhizobium leguminosarum]|uniref:hypothetical protein n=1 Tax=Rhizobium leguminosarum TaxID=384 RepID=UPI001030B43C|nr:hypothetical protein [Rhizobium leguminosarum]TBC89285.1 hypothetical protein ELH26_24855 [Rhizobium leguminosarum]